MKRSRIVLAGLLAVGLVGSVTASASASDRPAGRPDRAGSVATSGPRPGQCPLPPEGIPAGTPGHSKPEQLKLTVKDGTVYLNGKPIGSASADGRLVVAMKDGKVYVGKAAEAVSPKLPALPKLPAQGESSRQHIVIHSGGTTAGPVLAVQKGDDADHGAGFGMICVVRAQPGPGQAASHEAHETDEAQTSAFEG